MGNYVDGFVIPIKKKRLKIYKKMASLGRKVWMEHGALSYYECVGDDIKVPFGKPFNKLCKLKADETVIFAFIVFKSKAHRNKVNNLVMKDPRMNPETHGDFVDVIDMKKFTLGGFKVLVKA